MISVPLPECYAASALDPRAVIQAGLEIVGMPIECPSISRAKTVWAKVKIPTAGLVSFEK